jgi:hypothetical protein
VKSKAQDKPPKNFIKSDQYSFSDKNAQEYSPFSHFPISPFPHFPPQRSQSGLPTPLKQDLVLPVTAATQFFWYLLC